MRHVRDDRILWRVRSLCASRRRDSAPLHRLVQDFRLHHRSLGGTSIGTHLAIFTFRDHDDRKRREALIRTAISARAEVAEYARAAGLTHIFLEPMGVGREFGKTIVSRMELEDRRAAARMAVPMWMMADVDHGDVTSANPDEYDPHARARAVPPVTPIIRTKQSFIDKCGQRPYTAASNAKDRIHSDPLLAALVQGGSCDSEICQALSFERREANDRRVIPQSAESIAYWTRYIDTGVAVL